MALSPYESGQIAKADRATIVAALSRVISNGTGPWCQPNHKASQGVTLDMHPTLASAISPAEVAEYLALAAPNHCIDGWSYLSRALSAYLSGDGHTSWHLGYYAELRAAQAILSSCGLGAFNEWNAVLDSTGSLQVIDNPAKTRKTRCGQLPNAKGTHTMVWLALPEVIHNSSGGAAALPHMADIFGTTLPNLIAHAFPGVNSAQISARWLSDWAFDLEQGLTDKTFRNLCSYSPRVLTPHRANLNQAVSFIENFWNTFQPTPGATFLDLDKHILKKGLQDQALEKLRNQLGRDPNTVEMQTEIRSAHERLCAAEPMLNCISENFLTSQGVFPLIAAACDTSKTPQDPTPVLARATLLLRMATGVVNGLLKDAGYKHGNELDFWLEPISIEHGLIERFEDIRDDRRSLHQDLLIATEDAVREYGKATTPVTRAAFFANPAVNFHLLCQATCIPQWGLQP
ncbi:hypothetical protein [Limnohabitans sp. T6-5]|uniref:hypothetical protein n=1 Tax=Limnohabitans sp. T6-5 TaxID=1100724 RepID=UPI0011B1FDD4|nr:hypothetical protein [Limnohabitans sp. T6-5]